MADPKPKEETISMEKQKAPHSQPEARHEAESIVVDQKEGKGSSISTLFKPKSHKKAASLRALRSEDESSQLDTFPEQEEQGSKKKSSGLQDIPASQFTNVSDRDEIARPKLSFFAKLKAKWFTRVQAEILQEEESQNVSNRNVSLKSVKKTKLEGAYDTEREFMESVMTEKNVIDSYRVDKDGNTARGLVRSEGGSSKLLTKVLIIAAILLIIGGVALGTLYIKGASHPSTINPLITPNPKTSFFEFGKFATTTLAFKPEEILKLNFTGKSEKESIFRQHSIYFNSEHQVQQRVRTKTDFVVKRGRKLQDGLPNLIPDTRTESTETEELYRLITYLNAQGLAESIISFEGRYVNSVPVLPGTQDLSVLQDLKNTHSELNQPIAPPPTTTPPPNRRLLENHISNVRKLTSPTFTDPNADFSIKTILNPQCYKPMAKINYDANYQVTGILFPATQYYELLDNFIDIVNTLNPLASRQYVQDNDVIQTSVTTNGDVLVKTNANQTQYDQFGNQQQYSQAMQSTIYSSDAVFLSQVKSVNTTLPTDTQNGEIASVMTVIERSANLQKLTQDSIDYVRNLFDFTCTRVYCVTKSLSDFTTETKSYIDNSNVQETISSTFQPGVTDPSVTTLGSSTDTVQPFALTLFDLTVAGTKVTGLYQVSVSGTNFTALLTVKIGTEIHTIFKKSGNLDYLANAKLVKKLFTAILLKWNNIINYVQDKFTIITNQIQINEVTLQNLIKQAQLNIQSFSINSLYPDMDTFNLINDQLTVLLTTFKDKIGAHFDLVNGEFQDEILEIREYLMNSMVSDLTNKSERLSKIIHALNQRGNQPISPLFTQKLTALAEVLSGDFHTKLLDFKYQKFKENYENKKEFFAKILSNLDDQITEIGSATINNLVLRSYAIKALQVFYSENYMQYIGKAIINFKTEVDSHYNFGKGFMNKIIADIATKTQTINNYLAAHSDVNAGMSGNDMNIWNLFLQIDKGVPVLEDYNFQNTAILSLQRILRNNNKDLITNYFNIFANNFKLLEDSLNAAGASILAMLNNIQASFANTFTSIENSIQTQILDFWNNVQVLFTSFATYLQVKNAINTIPEPTVNIDLRDLTKLTILQDEMNNIINYKFYNQLQSIQTNLINMLYNPWNDLKPSIAQLVKVYQEYDKLGNVYLNVKLPEFKWLSLVSVKALLGNELTQAITTSNNLLITVPQSIAFFIHDQITNGLIGKIASFFTLSLTKITQDTIQARATGFLTDLQSVLAITQGQNLLYKDSTIYKKLIRSKGISIPIYTQFELYVDVTLYLNYNTDVLTSSASLDNNINVHIMETSFSSDRYSGVESIYSGTLSDGRVSYGVHANAIPHIAVNPSGNIDLVLFQTSSGVRKWTVTPKFSCIPSSQVDSSQIDNSISYNNLYRFMAELYPQPSQFVPTANCDVCTPEMEYAFSNPQFISGPITSTGYTYKRQF